MAFYAVFLAAIAVADVLADDFYGPLIVLVVVLLLGPPLATRLFDWGREPMPAEPRPSWRVTIALAAVLITLVVLEVAYLADFALGPFFWTMVILIPALEVYGYVARREASVRHL